MARYAIICLCGNRFYLHSTYDDHGEAVEHYLQLLVLREAALVQLDSRAVLASSVPASDRLDAELALLTTGTTAFRHFPSGHDRSPSQAAHSGQPECLSPARRAMDSALGIGKG
jgi:hypothetical protein